MSAARTSVFAPIDFKTRFPALDGVRALAIFMVWMEHYGGGAHGGGVLQVLNIIRLRGWIGVDIFFALSGFLITGILYDTRADSHYFKRFFVRRALRIFPVYYGVFVLLLVMTPFVHYAWQWGHLWFLVYLGNIFGNANFALYSVKARYLVADAFVGHFWSLCTEEQFYFLWPLVVFFVRKRIPLLWTAVSLSVVALFLRMAMIYHFGAHDSAVWIPRTLPFKMDSLLLGAALALLLRGPNADRVQNACKWVFVVFGVLTLGVMVASPAYDSPLMNTIGFTLIALASAGLIGSTLRTGSKAFTLFHHPWLRFLGKYSYGFYVYHVLFDRALTLFLGVFCTMTHSRGLGGLIALPLNFLMTLIVSKLSYDYFESWFLRRKKGFEYDSELATHEHAFRT